MPDGLLEWYDDRQGGHAAVEPVVEIVARDAQAEMATGYAERKVRRVMEVVDEPILHARVTLTVAPDPAVDRPALAQATLDVNGQLVRAHVAAHTMHAAVDLLEQRLRGRLQRRTEHARTRHRRPTAAEAGEWRHGQAPMERQAWYDRPLDERQVVRRKTFALDELTIDEAAFDMETLDLDFYLFRELATGGHAVLQRLPDGRFGLRRLDPSGIIAVGEAVEVDLEPGAAPELALEEALEWLNVADEPFVFFRARETGRASVVYRRYDGHYGLITPADEPAPPAEPSTARRRLGDELTRLEAVRAALLSEALDQETESESVAETSSIDQHQADVGSETFARERCQSLLDDVEREIADVQRAFVRLDRGIYGLCEACGTQIADERLSAVPAARFCFEHQAAAEVLGGLVT
jgi:RNA polymerase-binding transcription factor DksA/ribosome-associated translation inhibitor RaiA